MQLPGEWLSEANQYRLTDREARLSAPYLLNGAVLSLTDGALPLHLLVRADLSPGGTAWTATWVDRTSIGFAEMSAPIDGWSCYYEDGNGTVEPETAEAWSRPLSSVSVVKADKIRGTLRRTHLGKIWLWEARFTVHFGDGTVLDLSPFCTTTNDDADRKFREFVTAITTSS